jgi:DNA-binding IclR family transcriptional regulator
MSSPELERRWHFLTSHTQVLLCLHRDPEARLRDVAATVGITERATQRIVTDLVEAGYVTRARAGRRNHYRVNTQLPMRHPSQLQHQIVELLDLLRLEDESNEASGPKSPTTR